MQQISIRSLQHFLYCPHRWGLIQIDCSWAENYFVTKGNLIHERVHSGTEYALRGKRVYTAVKVWNDDYGLIGETDCIEEKEGKYTIVEYKPTKPSDGDFSEPDAIQIFAQKICVDQVFRCESDAVIYYADVKKRIHLPLKDNREQYLTTLKQTIEQMQKFTEAGIVPTIPAKQNCKGCSMKDLCIPSALKKRFDFRKNVISALGDT